MVFKLELNNFYLLAKQKNNTFIKGSENWKRSFDNKQLKNLIKESYQRLKMIRLSILSLNIKWTSKL
jgi:hypothetical protein